MKARHYDRGAKAHDHDGQTVELHWDDGRVAQMSGAETDDPRGMFLMVRVFPENGTQEYGGENGTAVSLHLRKRGRGWEISSLNAYTPGE